MEHIVDVTRAAFATANFEEQDIYNHFMAPEAVALIKQRGLARTGESIVLVSGMPFGLAGTTNALRVVTI